ncbi:hypothetical protein GR160_07660 [Flavobacterium sp. Sd200]|uniref:hypothetical protein n=1 Tax=Flavobacterium sp. Sd200 TaxID=2692211 RepID=UPI0013712EAF|nr:hypothetical protein [Flavobacterium sp. Sd200]MXN91104.1 hypothetical protein [Flavobacterium sp. Sd200]
MNKFYDISENENLPNESLQLRNLGAQRIFAITGGRRGSDYWGTRNTESQYHYTATVPEDYDNLFVEKLNNWKPIYNLGDVAEHHYRSFVNLQPNGGTEFLKHMKYVILPKLKNRKNYEDRASLFEDWLNEKNPIKVSTDLKHEVNYNTINMGAVNAPIQFQQSSHNSTQTQHNHYKNDDVKAAFDLLSKDIQKVNEQIRNDFAMEMDYAVTQLERNRDIKPQLMNIGSLMKDVGLGTFTNLLAAPIFEVVKPFLGLQ